MDPKNAANSLFGAGTAIALGGAIGAGWCVPGTAWCAVLGVCGAILIARLHSERAPLLHWYGAGVLSHLIAFRWLFGTIRNFGGFDSISAALIFALFVAVSALQFPICAAIARNLPNVLHRLALSVPCAWIASETIGPRIFPWQLGHMVLACSSAVQIAALAGAPLVTFILLWNAQALVQRSRGTWRTAILPLAALGASLTYGVHVLSPQMALDRTEQEVAVVQGNVSLEEKHSVQFFTVNRERYNILSRGVESAGRIIIWPESVVTEWVPAWARTTGDAHFLPVPQNGAAYLVGALSFESRERTFNSTFAITNDGSVAPPYHKQILMPFGEYTPFGSWLPWLKELNSTAGDFTAGSSNSIFALPTVDGPARVAPLICYEDVTPEIARRATQQGANLLVNLTNDAWFGPTAAPLQHHLIASFRAIENRRYLVRSTNTGLSAVVDPYGRTVSQLPLFSEGTLLAKVDLLGYKTPYTRWVGYTPWWVLTGIAVIAALGTRIKRSQQGT